MKNRTQKWNPIGTLNKRTFRQNKGRNIVAAAAVILTTLMFTTLFVLSQSITKNMTEMAFRQAGYDAQVSVKSITDQQFAEIRKHPDVTEAGESLVLGVAENPQLTSRQIEIRWADESYASHSFAQPTTGAMPEAAEEIALDTQTLDRLGVPHELGQEVTIQWRKDLTKEEMTDSTFTLCGFWEGNESSYAGMAWVSRPFADEMIGQRDGSDPAQALGIHMAQFHLRDERNISEMMDGILADLGMEDLEYGENLAYSPELNAAAMQEGASMYLGMGLVFLAGYLIIYNIFQISVTADIQFYGKLKTLGTTTKQIRKLIYGQANRLCLMGIPVGILMGYLLGMKLVPVLISWEETASVSASPVIFVGSALFAWLTVTISCLRPAKLAGKVSPMEALRYSDGGAKGKKQKKRSGSGASIAGMAWANLGRNKKRTVTVICSLTFALVLLSAFYAKNAAFDMEKYLQDTTLADFQVDIASNQDYTGGYQPQDDALGQEFLAQVNSLEGIGETGTMYSTQFTSAISENALQNMRNYYTEETLKEWESYDPEGARDCAAAMENKEAQVIVWGAEGLPLKTIGNSYVLDGAFDEEKFAAGEYILAVAPGDERTDITMPTYSVGEQVAIEGKTFTVMAVVYPLRSVVEGAREAGKQTGYALEFILPGAAFRELWPERNIRKFYFNIAEEQVEGAQTMLDTYVEETNSGLGITSRKSIEEQYRKQTRSSSVTGMAISVVIALVGVLNFINSMITSIVSRKKEFAMIQSVGMSRKQLQKLLIFEGLYYALITLVCSYAVSSLAVGIGVRAMVAGGYTTFRFTLLPLVLCTPVILGFAVMIPFICFKNLEKQSIVERLRTE